jgi:hypothetical protein
MARAPTQGRITDIQNRPSARTGLPEQPFDRRAVPPDVIPNTKGVKNSETGRLDHQSRPNGLRRIEPLEYRDPMTVALEEQGGSQSSRSATGNRNIERPHIHALEVITCGTNVSCGR